jgi:hypothetical protein
MWYFAYGSNLNAGAVAEWCRHFKRKAPALRGGQAAILTNYRLCFPIYSDYWGGGLADISYDPGKHVAGVVFELSEPEMRVLDEKVGRKVDSAGREIGVYRRVEVKVSRIGPGGRPDILPAITYQAVINDGAHVPPTTHYVDMLIQGCFRHGISTMWIEYLKSFGTHAGRLPKAPGMGDAESRL